MITKRLHEAGGGHPFDDLPEGLTVCAKDLILSCRSVEPNFLQLGRDLERIHTDAKGLLDRSTEAVENCGNISGESIFSGVLKSAESALARLQHNISGMDKRLQTVKEIIRQLEHLCREIPLVLRIAKSLRMVALNINIEASRYEDAEARFAEFGTGVKLLSDTVRDIGKRIKEDTEAAIAKLTAFDVRDVQGLSHLTGLAGAARKDLGRATSAVEQIMERFAATFKKAETHSKAISHQVAEIVLGVQIHDRVSQQIEHIARSLEEAKALCSGDMARCRKNAGQGYGTAYAILNLQALQLGQTIDDVNSVHASSLAALVQLERVIREVTQKIAATDSPHFHADMGPNTAENPMDTLSSVLDHINDLLGQGDQMLSQLHGAADEAAGSVARVSGHLVRIREINFDIHMKALNAIIGSFHIGRRGRSIAVLVQEMKTLSNQSTDFVSEMEKMIQMIQRTVQEIRTRDPEKALMDDALGDGLNELENMVQHFKDEGENLYRLGSELNSKIDGVKTDVNFLSAFSESLRGPLGSFHQIQKALSPYAGRANNDLFAEADLLSHRYTMEQERGIHEAFFNGTESALPAKPETFKTVEDPANADCGMDADSLGDNMELF
jgi:methyl-accepting chemotaxis protein